MSNNFVKKLRREATANPKKAAILGLLLLVAAYFWAPLIFPWNNSPSAATATTSPAPPAAAATAAVSSSPAPAGSAAAPAPQTKSKPKLPWRELAAAIDRDPRMRPAPAAHDAAVRDPFVAPRRPVEHVQADETEQKIVNEEKTPADMGLVLSSTIVGAGRRTAVINGKVYGPGRELKAADGVVFVVRQIEPWGIVLERAGRQFDLALPQPTP